MIDLFLHRVDPATPVAESIAAMAEWPQQLSQLDENIAAAGLSLEQDERIALDRVPGGAFAGTRYSAEGMSSVYR